MIQKEKRKKELNYIKILSNQNGLLSKKLQQFELELSDLKKSKELLSVKEIKEIYGISRSTLERYRKLGLRFNQPIVNGKLYISTSEIEKFLKTRKKW